MSSVPEPTTQTKADARAARKRDERLRYEALASARFQGGADADRWVRGNKLALAASAPGGVAFEDAAHARRVLDELAGPSFLLLERRDPPAGRGAGLDGADDDEVLVHTSYRLTERGRAFIFNDDRETLPGVWHPDRA